MSRRVVSPSSMSRAPAAHPVRDRITEIAILRVEGRRGRRALGRVWSRPASCHPAADREVTGISDAMVAEAPAFEVLADTVAALLEGCSRRPQRALRLRLHPQRLHPHRSRVRGAGAAPCTVKLSRALYPEHHRQAAGLDALIERHGLVLRQAPPRDGRRRGVVAVRARAGGRLRARRCWRAQPHAR